MEKYIGKLDMIAGREEAAAVEEEDEEEEEEEEEDMSTSSNFSELKDHCIQLLDLFQNPQKIPTQSLNSRTFSNDYPLHLFNRSLSGCNSKEISSRHIAFSTGRFRRILWSNQMGDWPIFQTEKEFPFFPVAKLSMYDSVPKECLLAFLQSEPASAAVGHWLSLLLKAADVEATRGHQGSSRLRIEASMTLRVLVARVGTADALAFYLPGIVSQIGKVLHVSRTMISGAAGSTEALNQAVRCLTEYLSIVLEDNSLGVHMNDTSGPCLSNEKPLASYLEELRLLPVKCQVRDSFVSPEARTTLSGQETLLDSSTKIASLRVKCSCDKACV